MVDPAAQPARAGGVWGALLSPRPLIWRAILSRWVVLNGLALLLLALIQQALLDAPGWQLVAAFFIPFPVLGLVVAALYSLPPRLWYGVGLLVWTGASVALTGARPALVWLLPGLVGLASLRPVWLTLLTGRSHWGLWGPLPEALWRPRPVPEALWANPLRLEDRGRLKDLAALGLEPGAAPAAIEAELTKRRAALAGQKRELGRAAYMQQLVELGQLAERLAMAQAPERVTEPDGCELWEQADRENRGQVRAAMVLHYQAPARLGQVLPGHRRHVAEALRRVAPKLETYYIHRPLRHPLVRFSRFLYRKFSTSGGVAALMGGFAGAILGGVLEDVGGVRQALWPVLGPVLLVINGFLLLFVLMGMLGGVVFLWLGLALFICGATWGIGHQVGDKLGFIEPAVMVCFALVFGAIAWIWAMGRAGRRGAFERERTVVEFFRPPD